MKTIAAFLFIFITVNAYAGVTGTGCAKPRNKALEYALSDISEQIAVRIESELYRHVMQAGGQSSEYISYKTRITSDLPILGYTASDDKDCVTVTLYAEKALPLYVQEAEKLRTRINSLAKQTDLPDNVKLPNLSKALEDYAEWHKLALVAVYLGGNLIPPEVNMGDIEREIITMKRISADIPQIADNILDNISSRQLYVNSVKLSGSQAIPPFASLLTSHLRQKTRSSPEGARQEMNCQYSPEGDPFIIACEIRDIGVQKPARLVITSVSPKICEQIDCYNPPAAARLENLFHSRGDRGLRGHFYTNWGSDGVILSEGDVVSVFARVSTPAELALISVPISGDAKIIPLSASNVRKISINDTNRPVELIKLKVTPPFGDEALVLIGYGGDLSSILTQESFAISELNKLRQQISDKPHFEKTIIFHTRAGAL